MLTASIIRATIIIIALVIAAASTSETSANFHQTARRNNPEDSHLLDRRRENLKSHTLMKLPGDLLTSWATISFSRLLLYVGG
jgi:hypothetical protein